MLQIKVFILKLFTVDTFTSTSVALGKVSCQYLKYKSKIVSESATNSAMHRIGLGNSTTVSDIPPWIMKLGTVQ